MEKISARKKCVEMNLFVDENQEFIYINLMCNDFASRGGDSECQ